MGIVERTEELSRLAESLGAPSAAGRILLIEGAAALGKTRLLGEFAQRAVDSGATFLGARASRAERELPLSAIGQLFRGPALSDPQLQLAERLLSDGALTATVRAGGDEFATAVQVQAPILSRLCAILLEVAERGPLVIAVDDIQHADGPSLQFLLYLTRRTEAARILLVLTECLRPSQPQALLHADLLRQPGTSRLRLKALSAAGVAAVLAEHLDPLTAQRLTPECHRVSGGNPLLVHALIEDYRMAGPSRPVCLVFGDAFRQAVLSCLYRCESTTVGRGMAVLPESASAILIGELVELDAGSVGLTRDVLRVTGLVDSGGLRHEAIRAAVLSGMRPDQRTALQVRAAGLLHGHGASAAVVADRLAAADQARFPWAVTVLREVADQAMAEGRAEAAIEYLRLAFRECTEAERPAVRLALARAEWQVDPSIAARHVPELTRDLRHGRLPAEGAATLIGWRLWLGRVDDALEILAAGEAEVPHWWLHHGFPGIVRQHGIGDLRPAPDDPPAGASKVAAMLDAMLVKNAHAEVAAQAEQILGEGGPAFRTLAPVLAIAALIHADELDCAERWCDALGRSAYRRTPVVNALLAVLRGLIHQRRGDLHAAERCARESLELLPARGWGVFAALPVGLLIGTLTAAGRWAEAERYLDTPLPETLFHSPLVLPYLQARGRHDLATHRPQAALAEFQACGDLMDSWGMDVPGLVPWRIDLAWARLALGDVQHARKLAEEQLSELPGDRHRTRGMALRVLAATSAGGRRLDLLTAAVKALELSGDRLELARTLADLSDGHRLAGDSHRADLLAKRARSLAAGCGAADVGGASAAPPADPGGHDPDADPLTGLSEAERRVAALAADGYTNQQIALRLHVTRSTVEQHLTRVYRKLKISRRADLPLNLLFSSQDSAV
jgi:DNA-binding CsgD family transcriptional regulator